MSGTQELEWRQLTDFSHRLVKYPFFTSPIQKSGPNKPQLSRIRAWFWDGGSIGRGALSVYDSASGMEITLSLRLLQYLVVPL